MPGHTKVKTLGYVLDVLVDVRCLVAAKALEHTREHDDKLKYAWSMDLV